MFCDVLKTELDKLGVAYMEQKSSSPVTPVLRTQTGKLLFRGLPDKNKLMEILEYASTT